MEIWKPVTKEPFNKYYEVSSLGRVKRGDRMLADFNVNGYRRAPMQCEGQIWMAHLHKVVALAFLGDPPDTDDKWTVNHKNFDKSDNRPENLEWMTMGANLSHALKGRRNPRGEQHPRAKLTEQIVRDIRALRAQGMLIHDISAKLSIPVHAASDVLSKRTWSHVE